MSMVLKTWQGREHDLENMTGERTRGGQKISVNCHPSFIHSHTADIQFTWTVGILAWYNCIDTTHWSPDGQRLFPRQAKPEDWSIHTIRFETWAITWGNHWLVWEEIWIGYENTLLSVTLYNTSVFFSFLFSLSSFLYFFLPPPPPFFFSSPGVNITLNE